MKILFTFKEEKLIVSTGIGPQGNKGDTGNGIESVSLNPDYTLTIECTDGTSYTTESIRGAKGDKGDKGDKGNGIASTVLNSDYTLTINFTDGTSYTTECIRGAKGDAGNGITSVALNSDYTLTIRFDDETSYTTSPIRGEKGAKGDRGTGIASTVLNPDYTLTITLTDGTSYTTGSIRGAKGDKGDPGESFTLHICSSSEYDSTTRVPTIQNPDASTMYLVPSADAVSPDLFVEWVYINNAWERFGSATVAFDRIANGTGECAVIVGDTESNDASGDYAYAEGAGNTASGDGSHAEGVMTSATGMASHSEGVQSTASGDESHAEGFVTTASGAFSHSEGTFSTASGRCAHAEGTSTIANAKNQHVSGSYNVADVPDANGNGQYLEIIGNGTSNNARSNARTLDWNGNESIAGKMTVGADPANAMDVTTKKYVDDALSEKIDSPSTAGTSGQVLTSDGNGGQSWEDVSSGVSDVQVDGTSVVTDGVAEIPRASNVVPGVAKVTESNGIAITNADGTLFVSNASSAQIKNGANQYKPIVPSTQHESVFYGLTKAAGVDMANSSNAVGTYTDEALKAIRKMLGIPNQKAELINEVSVSEDSTEIVVDTDANGQPFKLSKLVAVFNANEPTTGARDNFYVQVKYEDNSTGVIGTTSSPSLMYSSATSKLLAKIRIEAIPNMPISCQSITGTSEGNTGNLQEMPKIQMAKNIRSIRIYQASTAKSLIPAGATLTVYGIRYDD